MSFVGESHFHSHNGNEFSLAKVISIIIMKMTSVGEIHFHFRNENENRHQKVISIAKMKMKMGRQKSFPSPKWFFSEWKWKSACKSHFHCRKVIFSEWLSGNEYFPFRKWSFSISEMSFPFRDENEMTFSGQREEMSFREWFFPSWEWLFPIPTMIFQFWESHWLENEMEMSFASHPERWAGSRIGSHKVKRSSQE